MIANPADPLPQKSMTPTRSKPLQSHRPKPVPFVASLLLLLMIPGSACVDLEREYPEKKHFVLSAERPAAARDGGSSSDEITAARLDTALKIGRFRVSPRFSGRGLVYRRSDVAYESDFYNEFLTSAAVNLTEETRLWLERSRLFRRVVSLSSQVDTCYILEAQINEIYADLRESPRSTINVQFLLLESGQKVLFDRTYRRDQTAIAADAANLVRAHNENLSAILRDLERDLGSELSTERVRPCGSAPTE